MPSPTRSASPRRCAARCWWRRSTTPSAPWRSSRPTRADLAAVIVEPLERVLVPQPGFLESHPRGHPPPRHRADLRRGRHRLPHRLGRRPGALRRRARPGHLRQGDARRLPDGRHRRAPDVMARLDAARAPSVATWSGPAARSTATRSAPRPAWRRSESSAGRAPTSSSITSAAACGARSRRSARATASPPRPPARTPSSACASPSARICAAGRTC